MKYEFKYTELHPEGVPINREEKLTQKIARHVWGLFYPFLDDTEPRYSKILLQKTRFMGNVRILQRSADTESLEVALSSTQL